MMRDRPLFVISKKGVEIPGVLKVGLEKIYCYTNNKEDRYRGFDIKNR